MQLVSLEMHSLKRFTCQQLFLHVTSTKRIVAKLKDALLAELAMPPLVESDVLLNMERFTKSLIDTSFTEM